jgi:hypothetical protein
MYARIILIIVGFALLPSVAQNLLEQDAQQRADALFDKARHLSDIRSSKAPAFRLTATFSFTGVDLETLHGTYTELWVSSSQWRRETVVNQWKRLEVSNSSTDWLLDNTTDFPPRAAQLSGLVDFFPPKSAALLFETITDHPETNPPADCAITKPDLHHLKSAFCFEKKSGVLLEKMFPEIRPRNAVSHSQSYGSYRKFGDFYFPRQMEGLEDKHKLLDLTVVDLSLQPSPDPALFTPPPGAIELGNCSGTAVEPSFESNFPETFGIGVPPRARGPRDPDQVSWTAVWLVVDTKGKPQYAKVEHPAPGNKAAEKRILNRVREWRFKPGTCDGVPMPMPLHLQLPSWD